MRIIFNVKYKKYWPLCAFLNVTAQLEEIREAMVSGDVSLEEFPVFCWGGGVKTSLKS